MSAVRRTKLHLELAGIVRRMREAAGMQQEELAERVGRPQSFVSKIETAERRIDAVDLFALARGLGVPIEAIVGEMRRVVEADPDGWDDPPTARRRKTHADDHRDAGAGAASKGSVRPTTKGGQRGTPRTGRT